MFKFLRRYSKYILAVFGTLLLVTFLIPFAFTELLQGAGQRRAAWATVGLEQKEKVTVRELAVLQRELRLLQVLAPQLPSLADIDRAEYWYLLVREADQAGLIGSPAALALGPDAAQQLQTLAGIAGESVPFVRSTLAKIDGVTRLQGLYLDPNKYSDRRLKAEAAKLFHRATIQPVVIEASAPSPPRSFSEGELIEQMRKYADKNSGEGEKGFGYKLPHRAKLEWLAISADSVRGMIEASDQLNPVELRKHWRRNAERFEQPEPGAPVPDAVREDLVATLTEEALDRIAREASDALRLRQRELERRTGYFVVPEGWSGLPLQELALELQESRNLALPEYHAVGDRWLTAGDLAALPGIGPATTMKFGNEPVALPELVMAARELAGSATIPMQESIAGPPVRGADGTVYIFRITATDASRAPESLDEVRQQVIDDLNRLVHYEQLAARAEEIRAAAIQDGLTALALAYDTAVSNQVSVSLGFPAAIPVIGADEDVSRRIIEHVLSLPADQPVRSLPLSQRILVIPVEDRLSVLVARIDSQLPLTEETYRSYMQYGLVLQRLFSDELGDRDPTETAFSYEALAARHGFELARGDDEDAADQETDAPAGTARSG